MSYLISGYVQSNAMASARDLFGSQSNQVLVKDEVAFQAARSPYQDLYARGVATAIRRGEVDRIIAEALRDGEIDEAELAEIIVAHRQHLAARHAEVGAVITLHRRVKA